MKGAPVVRVTVASPVPVIRITAPTMPAVVRIQSLGPQGPAGPQGLPSYAKGFGTIDFTDNDTVVFGSQGQVISGTAVPLPAGQWVRIRRNLTPSAANFNLPSGPWAGFAFWDNASALLKARAVGDTLLYKFSFTVIPAQRNGGLRFAVRPGDDPAFDFGPEPIVLTADAGVPQEGAVSFPEQCRTRFVKSGASIYLMATTGATLLSFSPEIYPLDYALPTVAPPPIQVPATPSLLDFTSPDNSGLLAALGIVSNAGTGSADGTPGALDFSVPSNSSLLAVLGA